MLCNMKHVHALNSQNHYEKSVADDNEQSKIKPEAQPLWALAVIDSKWPAAPPFYFLMNKRRTWAFECELGPTTTNGRRQQKCDVCRNVECVQK